MTLPEFYVRERASSFCFCGKPATHEVRNSRNAVMDWFCKRHAEERCRELNKEVSRRE